MMYKIKNLWRNHDIDILIYIMFFLIALVFGFALYTGYQDSKQQERESASARNYMPWLVFYHVFGPNAMNTMQRVTRPAVTPPRPITPAMRPSVPMVRPMVRGR